MKAGYLAKQVIEGHSGGDNRGGFGSYVDLELGRRGGRCQWSTGNGLRFIKDS
ncbi:hypothetical protein MIDIC_310009 [Alphaproteobacteria bacterium]